MPQSVDTLITRATQGIEGSGYTIHYKQPPGGNKDTLGETDQFTRTMWVQPYLRPEMQLAVLLHEWTHVLLYTGERWTTKWNYSKNEQEARIACFVALTKLGLHVPDEAVVAIKEGVLMFGPDLSYNAYPEAIKAADQMVAALR